MILATAVSDWPQLKKKKKMASASRDSLWKKKKWHCNKEKKKIKIKTVEILTSSVDKSWKIQTGHEKSNK